jgi:4-alpha-glucanotransferase
VRPSPTPTRRPPRFGGLLLHPTSLPGEDGIGDLGPAARRWIEWLAGAGCTLWQILPLGPTGFGDSPYQSFSAFAGNPLLISLPALADQGLLTPEEVLARPSFSPERVAFGQVFAHKERLLSLAAERFAAGEPRDWRPAYDAFCQENAYWLDDFALFMALKRQHRGAPWTEWPEPLAAREPRALTAAAADLAPEVDAQRFCQFVFFRQWTAVREAARAAGVTIIGDMPIYVAHDSADVWARHELFDLEPDGRPRVVAGVPPDFFSATGQLWGNPLYRWDGLRESGYAWWVERFRQALEMVDLVRLDHFRGFEAYWEVPAEAPTAEPGRWVPGPGADFLRSLRTALGRLPIIAEDLGVITPEVVALRDDFELPGMKVLQFAFSGDPLDEYLPHNFPARCVVYTGTHDNDTSRGWYEQAPEAERGFVRRYLASDGGDIAWDLIRAAWSSVAERAIAPLQDALGLGSEARMNTPGRPEGNWTWRVREAQLTPELAERLAELNFLYGRAPDGTEAD